MTSDFGADPESSMPPAPETRGTADRRADPGVADQVVAAVSQVPGVARMHAGMFGEVATYLPGRRVEGVQLRDDVANVHVVVRWGVPIPGTVDAIRTALRLVVDKPVNVTIEDVEAQPDTQA